MVECYTDACGCAVMLPYGGGLRRQSRRHQLTRSLSHRRIVRYPRYLRKYSNGLGIATHAEKLNICAADVKMASIDQHQTFGWGKHAVSD